MGKLSKKAYHYLITKPKMFNLLYGSVSSGKTYTSLMNMPARFNYAPKGDILMTGKTERTLYRNVISPLIKMFGSRRVKYSKGMGEGSIDGREFYAVGANNETSVEKIQGASYAYNYSDEAVTYPKSFIDMLVSRLRLDGSFCDWTMNPASPYHHIKTNFIDNEDIDIHAWHFTLEDNLNLKPSYIETLKALYPKGSLFYKRFILGLWVFAEGAVYDFFNEDVHVLTREKWLELPIPDYYTLSSDYGTGNETVVGLFRNYRGHKTRGTPKSVLEATYIYSGRNMSRSRTDSEHAQALQDFMLELKGVKIPEHRNLKVDPSAASFKEQLRRDGWTVKDAKNDVLDGIRTQAEMLKSGLYVIGPHPSNQKVIQDYSSYLWDKKAQDRGEDRPLKDGESDNTKDMERYEMQTEHFKSGSSIEEIKAATGYHGSRRDRAVRR